ncbi:MAG: hypothetical protein ACLRPW_11260 [Intestinibacter sp.]
MKVFGADVTPSPSNTTNAGRKILEQNPDDPGFRLQYQKLWKLQ